FHGDFDLHERLVFKRLGGKRFVWNEINRQIVERSRTNRFLQDSADEMKPATVKMYARFEARSVVRFGVTFVVDAELVEEIQHLRRVERIALRDKIAATHTITGLSATL